jgi:hypothetical protein
MNLTAVTEDIKTYNENEINYNNDNYELNTPALQVIPIISSTKNIGLVKKTPFNDLEFTISFSDPIEFNINNIDDDDHLLNYLLYTDD